MSNQLHVTKPANKSLLDSCQYLWASTLHVLVSLITFVADVNLFADRDSWAIFCPQGIFVWLQTARLCVSVWHLLEELWHCRPMLALNWGPFGSRTIFPLSAEWGDLVSSQICRLPSCLKRAWNFSLMAYWFLFVGTAVYFAPLMQVSDGKRCVYTATTLLSQILFSSYNVYPTTNMRTKRSFSTMCFLQTWHDKCVENKFLHPRLYIIIGKRFKCYSD